MRRFWLLALLALCPTGVAHASIIIEVLNANLNAGSLGTVDVLIRSDGLGGPDTLGRFGYEFNISGASPAAGDLQFRFTQSNSEQTEAGPPAYIFFGDTDSGNFNSQRGVDAVTLLGSDILATLDFVPLSTSNLLLARLELEHIGSFVIGSHPFTISLNATSTFTEFDRDFDGSTDNSYTEFSTLSGTITVNGAPESGVVPEPSSIVLFGLVALACGFYRRRRSNISIRQTLAGSCEGSC